MAPVVIGVDSSTQSTKVVARRLDTGALVARGSAVHPPATPPVSEQDPGAWWAALRDAVGQLGDIRREVVAISVAAQQHGLVLIDGAGSAVRPAKLWNDTTSAAQAASLVADLGTAVWADACGSVPVAAFTITKLAWLVENEPGALEAAARIMLPHDYLTWRLSGAHVTDRGDASGTGWFDPSTGAYRQDLLRASGAGGDIVDRLPEVLGPLDPAGALTAAAANDLGLPAGVLVGPGTGDNMGAALGLGLRSGDVVVSLGTSGTVYAASATATADRTGAVAGFADATGSYLPLVCTLNATKVTDTVAAWLQLDVSALADLALRAAGDAGGVTAIPYFDGERTPNLPDATGSFFGLRPTTTREQLALAAHDGVLCGLMDGVAALAGAGVDTGGRLLLVGGGAQSVAYQQRCADLSERPVTIPDVDEAVATGAGLQAAAVFGRSGLETLADEWNLGAERVIEPSPGADGAATVELYRHRASNQPGA